MDPLTVIFLKEPRTIMWERTFVNAEFSAKEMMQAKNICVKYLIMWYAKKYIDPHSSGSQMQM